MTIIQNSWLYRAVWLRLLRWSEGSALLAWLAGADEALMRGVRGSALCRFVSREGCLSLAWESSLTCRAVRWAANCVPKGLNWCYSRTSGLWEGSAAFRAVCGLGEGLVVPLSWFLLVLLVCPQEYWNNLYSLAFAVLGLALLYIAGGRRREIRLETARFNPWLWGFFLMLCVGVVESGALAVSLRYLMFFVTAALTALLVISSVRTVDHLVRLSAFATGGMFISALYAFYQRFVVGIRNTSATVDFSVNANLPGRVYSFFENANTYAQLLVVLLGVALGLLFACRTNWGRLACLAAVGCGTAAILMTYSRASWIGLVVMVFLFVLLTHRRLIPLLVLCAVALVPFLPATVFKRILTIFDPSDSSTASRFPIYLSGLRVWSYSPLTGTGLGSELSAALGHNRSFYKEAFLFPHYHNIYLQLAVEIGLFGMIAYVGGFISACRQSLKAAFGEEADRRVRHITAGCFSGMCGLMVCGLADYFWHYPRVMVVFWFVFAMMLCAVGLAGRQTASSEGT